MKIMRLAKNSLILFCLIGLLAIPAFAFEIGRGINSFTEGPPPPRLLAPIGETIDLTGKDTLEFRWIWDNAAVLDGYEFRVFKGRDTTQANLIYKTGLSRDTSSLAMEADRFENGQVYTWTLKAVSLGGQKSDPSSNSFRVIKN